MADVVPSSGDYIRPYRNPWGSAQILPWLESTSQTFRRGDLIQDLDGRAQAATVSGSTVTSTSIIGIAAEGASSAANTRIGIWAANPVQEFWARTRNGLTQSSIVGTGLGLVVDSTLNIFLVDLGNAVSTSQRVIVTENLESTGSSGGAVAFIFGSYNSTVIAFHGRSGR